jgi:integrase
MPKVIDERRIKFSDRVLRALPSAPHGERVEYTDSEVTGLRLRVSSSGVKTFTLLRRTKHGPPERMTLGRFDEIKCEQARTEALKLIGRIASGANPAEVKRANKGEPTFAELFAEYIERHAKPRKRTWCEDEQKYRDYLERPLARKKVSRIVRADLAAIHSAITGAGHPTVANRVKDLISSVFGRAISWGYVDSNPAKGIEDNRERSRERFLKPGELPRLFAALDGEPNTNFRDYFLLALLTGARRNNVVAMRWTDLDLERGEWAIPRTKNGEPQRVPLVPEAVAILTARLEKAAEDARFVFPAARADSKLGHMSGERKAWLRLLERDEIAQLKQRIEAKGAIADGEDAEHPANTLQRFRRVAKRLKINTDGARLDDIRIHDLRRTMGSWQARTGASLAIIGKTLGHKSQQATAVYARLDLDPIREAMETATTAMWRAGNQKPSADVLPYKKRA